MSTENPAAPAVGRVASLHLHSSASGLPLQSVDSISLVEGKGIEGEPRYFGRRNSSGQPSRRQVTLMAREQIREHAIALSRSEFAPGAVRSNIETTGIDLVSCLGKRIAVGESVLFCYEARRPCAQMDALAPGLKLLMENGRQGVLAEVVSSGRIAIGDEVKPL